MRGEPKIPLLQSSDPRVTVGRYSYGRPTFFVWGEDDSITIGNFCSIADEVAIFGGGEHRADWITTYPIRIAFGLDGAGEDGHPSTKGPTSIGNDVWIGFRAIILSGVSVGDGAVVAAGSVVTRDVEPYTIVGGSPANPIRFRFPQEVREKLLMLAWWHWPLEKILEHVEFLCSDRVTEFIALHARVRK